MPERPGNPAESPRSPERPRAFQYAILRVVPHVERGERFNAGVILFCRQRGFLAARTELDERRLAALDPERDPALVRAHLDALVRIAAGDADAGHVAALDQSERFHWLVAPSSTIIQPSEVHTGLTQDPAKDLDRLFGELVATPAPPRAPRSGRPDSP
jgi:hypothetical protein